MEAPLGRRAVAEAIGTALLLCAIVGSGIMGERLSGGNASLALLANTLSTGAALCALILTFGPISGAHFNPVVTLAEVAREGVRWPEVPVYVAAQFLGAILGVAAANVMFGEPLLSASDQARSGGRMILSECIATFGLLSVIMSCSRWRPNMMPFAVPAYIMSAYWFTASTSFANPTVTVARAMSNTFTGIRPMDVPGFIVGQVAGAFVAMICFRWIWPGGKASRSM